MSKKTIVTDKRLFYKITIAQRLLLKFMDQESTKKIGVSVTQTGALFYLMKNDGCLLKDLSRVLMQNKSAITTLVERMEKNGLIIKKKSKTDGRASHIFLTEKGQSTGKRALSFVGEFNEGLLEQFTESEIVVIHRFLDIIIENYS